MTRFPRRMTLLAAAALLAAGCSAPFTSPPATGLSDAAAATGLSGDAPGIATTDDAPAPVRSGTEVTASAAAAGTVAADPASTAPHADGTISGTTEETAASTTPETSSSMPPTGGQPLPGGTEGLVDLVRHGWLDGSGRFHLTAATAAQVIEIDASATVCDFLFGTVAQVSALTLLPDGSTLDELSGPQVRDDAMRFGCVYDIGGAPALVLQVGVGPKIDPDLPGRPRIVTVGEVQAVLSYAPDRDGIAVDLADRWLAEAAGRINTG